MRRDWYGSAPRKAQMGTIPHRLGSSKIAAPIHRKRKYDLVCPLASGALFDPRVSME
jgi:hypothetical protein